MKKIVLTILLLALALLLCACRVRTTLLEPEPQDAAESTAQEPVAPVRIDATVPPKQEEPQAEEPPEEEPPEEEPSAQPEAPTEQDETSEQRAYAPEASGELTPEAETPLYAPTDESAETAVPTPSDGGAVNVEADGAEQTATETVPADEAEQLGVDEDGEVAESVQSYYLTLLDSRLGTLFECKRLYVYWETDGEHRTIRRADREHQLILGAGAYDVSAKLTEDGLIVDDGWVFRKNPDAVVKVMDGGALDPAAAQALCDALAARDGWDGIHAVQERRVIILSGQLLDSQAGQTAAMVYLAKLLYPEQMADVDADEALRALTEEAFGSAFLGTYAYTM